ncbi:MAG: elongation factor P maturation arginine rhamnosyltransferase EarP [Candidatus Gracilibacteria bacterium]|nr:elongation factor P maturation arginine rhamnosyltransferase EarP [Candidatus Gracilibacteria bacterium]
MKIDFYIDVIDNFGDLGFAINLASIMLKDDTNYELRIFSNDENLFKNMIKGDSLLAKLSYFDLSKIHDFKPNNIIFNFFDRKIDFSYLNLSGENIKLINFGYFLLHRGVENLHLTNYKVKNVEVTHFIPSLLEQTGGILINKCEENVNRDDFLNFILDKYNLFFSIPKSSKIVSIFVYKNTLNEILEFIKTRNFEDTFFFIFGFPNLDIKIDNVIPMPFIDLKDYQDFISYCDINFVRGENSLVNSLIFGKATLWDIYKENNDAHTEKIDDYLRFLSIMDNYNLDYNQIMLDFNGTGVKKGFSDFINNQNNYKVMFESLGNYINKNCNAYEKIKKILKF